MSYFRQAVEYATGKPTRGLSSPRMIANHDTDAAFRVLRKCWRYEEAGSRWEPRGVVRAGKYWTASVLSPELGLVTSGGWNETAVKYSQEP